MELRERYLSVSGSRGVAVVDIAGEGVDNTTTCNTNIDILSRPEWGFISPIYRCWGGVLDATGQTPPDGYTCLWFWFALCENKWVSQWPAKRFGSNVRLTKMFGSKINQNVRVKDPIKMLSLMIFFPNISVDLWPKHQPKSLGQILANILSSHFYILWITLWSMSQNSVSPSRF